MNRKPRYPLIGTIALDPVWIDSKGSNVSLMPKGNGTSVTAQVDEKDEIISPEVRKNMKGPKPKFRTVGKNGITRRGMRRAFKNWCPVCREYKPQRHAH